jgi:E3 ubiquitin-protein ligase listerin
VNQVYDPDTPLGVQVLAAHVYYRSLLLVPSLIRTWVNDCKDRTLSRTITTYTSTHFSPVLLDAELTRIMESDATADLSDENLTIKVAKSVNEVTASLTVDEHHLELTLKLPSDWPLHTVEIKDEKRVGVLEDRWRSWVLGVFAHSQV